MQAFKVQICPKPDQKWPWQQPQLHKQWAIVVEPFVAVNMDSETILQMVLLLLSYLILNQQRTSIGEFVPKITNNIKQRNYLDYLRWNKNL